MATQNDRLMDHDYDGIEEYDNPMPGWWTALFWVTIVFSAGYWFYYHTMGTGTVVADEYAADMQELQALQKKFALPERSEDELKAMVADPQVVQTGAAKFKEVCAACHGEQGEGKIGPNLTDDAWLHGGSLRAIYASIGNGVPAKGMPAWGRVLKHSDTQAVAAFVGSLKGKKVPGKAAQGTVEP
ncbi:MAG: c-type cytochrome [Deltaproteobacteria bacterium]|nr:c-type cytochrome [Deltaproteobacteria bacterium]